MNNQNDYGKKMRHEETKTTKIPLTGFVVVLWAPTSSSSSG